jgi:integrase
VRDLVTVLAETGIRRSTLWRIEAPKHYRHGARELVITHDVDKARAGRPIPLTPAARKALDRLCPKGHEGPIAGHVDLRYQLAVASKRIGLPEHLAGRVSYHDLRHAFITDLAASGASLAGIQYLAGHGNAATSARYIHPARSAAEEALALRGRTPRRTPKTKTAPKPKPRSRRSA